MSLPVLLQDSLLREHMLVVGPTGAGKTALSLHTLAAQLIRRGDGAVIINDCKGDPALFQTVLQETHQAGRVCKHLTNKPFRSTYVFNPFGQAQLRRLTLSEIVGLYMSTLNLIHGDDHGRQWFSTASRTLFSQALRRRMQERRGDERRLHSFLDLRDALWALTDDAELFRAALQLAFTVQGLTEFEQLNLSPDRDPRHPALRHAISMPEVIREKQVVYAYLEGITDIRSVAEIARLLTFSALSAAVAHRDRTGRTPRVYLICDEAQTLIAQNIANLLTQARSMGLAFILAMQSLDQLNPPGGVDLRDLVLSCTCVKQFFDARDLYTRQYISEISGQVGYANSTWTQTADDVLAGRTGRQFAVGRDGEDPLMKVGLQVGPRLNSEDIDDVGSDPNRSILTVGRSEGFTAFQGAFPIHTDWPISKGEYHRRADERPWPATTDETIEIDAFWPEETEETIVPTTHPGLPAPTDDEVQATLEQIKGKLGLS